jgi:hypothetical protein
VDSAVAREAPTRDELGWRPAPTREVADDSAEPTREEPAAEYLQPSPRQRVSPPAAAGWPGLS